MLFDPVLKYLQNYPCVNWACKSTCIHPKPRFDACSHMMNMSDCHTMMRAYVKWQEYNRSDGSVMQPTAFYQPPL